jgi:hypothetical protein
MPNRTSGYRRVGFVEGDPGQKSTLNSNLFSLIKGRKFAAWIDADSRNNGYNAANLIENPAYIIESILRDVLGHASAVINYQSIDDLGNTTNGRRKDWKLAASVTAEQNSLNLIAEICENSGMILVHDYANKERLVALDHYNPVDQLSASDVTFENLKPQVRVRQTHVKYICNEFYLNYKYNYGSGNYDKQLFVTASDNNLADNTRSDATYATYEALCAGSQSMYNTVRRWTYDANWIRDDATAELFIKTMADWLSIRKWEVEATLWYSAKTLKLEVLDQVTWNLDLLPVSVRDQAVTDLDGIGTDGGSLSGTVYYVVCAYDPNGEGKVSNERPVNLAATGSTATSLAWSPIPGATKYRIHRGTSSGTYAGYYETTNTYFTDTGAAFTGTTAAPISAGAFFISNVIDYGLKGGGRVKMSFHLVPYIFL